MLIIKRVIEQVELFEVESSPDLQKEASKKKRLERVDLDKGIEELVGAICDPIIAWPSPWKDDIPDWLKTRIKLDRLIECMKYSKGEEITATDSEALAYMIPLTLERPIDREWTEIYLYLGTIVCESEKKVMPDDIRRTILDTEQTRDLNDLKRFIYNSRVKHRTETRSKFKRERKEEEAAEKEILQPKFF